MEQEGQTDKLVHAEKSPEFIQLLLGRTDLGMWSKKIRQIKNGDNY